MKTIRTIAGLRTALAGARRNGRVIGLVPTMGTFHEGHLSLMRHARSRCDVVVVSLFVNPAQFNDPGDLAVYPRNEAEDAARAAELGIDYLFAPGVEEVYPAGFATTVSVSGLTESLEGAERGRGHFDGVTTVVTKLLNMVGPDTAYFGQKDAQQAAVIRRLVGDLNIPVEIEVCPTVRAEDGLALSSRNQLLSAIERRQATALHRALRGVRDAVHAGGRDPAVVTEPARRELAQAGIEAEYLSVVSAQTLEPVERIDGDVLAVIAARVGAVRLIDNVPISVAATEEPPSIEQITEAA
ncbi:MAG TPA: pantoate--beta-alanine ligase [Solirubrobacteraceae bacterium]|jgi:pantoate--beta-alanine ligase|nr:pantoate--beta-alanine ligase [Solirubrobacteraceae bacterium]